MQKIFAGDVLRWAFVLIATISMTWLSISSIHSVQAAGSYKSYNKSSSKEHATNKAPIDTLFLDLVTSDSSSTIENSLAKIEKVWSINLVPFALETISYTKSSRARGLLIDLVKNEFGKKDTFDINAFYQWIWNKDIDTDPGYANFKAKLYRKIDVRFDKYFANRQDTARIRLDEIRWGGVLQDGIPPLRNPKMLSVKKATYLEDDNIVFGIVINGDARAYPKRILAWHEMFTDTIGGVDIAGVYCTLCGTVIPYRTEVNGVKYTIGTSGFLYRSNKLMYDKATQSLWSTERGEPVLGPLVDKGIVLPFESVVTTTWGEWRKRHPKTTVLSLNTGHSRDYGEGVAYSNYFSSDELMFNTPFNDSRLQNKREILALRFAGAPKEQLAIDTQYLNKNPIYKNAIGRQKFVVFTDTTGANRVYDPKDVNFVSFDQQKTAVDDQGVSWVVEEEQLRSDKGKVLPRLPYHRAFWFGWHAAFPKTKLIK